MTKLAIKGSWNQIKGKLKQKYARLTKDGRMRAEGRDDEILGRIQKAISRIKDGILPKPAAL